MEIIYRNEPNILFKPTCMRITFLLSLAILFTCIAANAQKAFID
jgi:hypothetical protein